MIKSNKKETIMSIVALLFIVLVVIGITYAAFNYTGLGTKSNKVTTSTITMNYNEATNGITLTDAFPISDNDGKQLTGEGKTFSFTVTVTTGNNTAVGYEVSAVKDNTSTLGNNDVRIYLEKSTTGAEGTYSSVLEPTGFSGVNATTEIGTPAGEMLLHSDSTTSTRTDYYILRMWVDENYQITGESKFFTIKVNVYGTDSHINVSSISLNKNSMTLDEEESEQLSATVLPDYATNKSVTWESSNTDVAVVDSSGNVTAQSISGTTATATITARDANGHSASCVVTVNKPEPTGVEIEDNILELNLIAPGEASGETIDGSSTILEAGTTPSNANSNEVEWTTSDSDVLDVEKYTEANASGTGSSKSVVANKVKVTAKGAGSATLTVKSASNPSAPSKSITVTIQEPESTGLSIDKPNVTIDRNSSTTITATLNLSNSRDKTIYWSNSDASIASMNCTGGSTNSSGEIETTSATAVCNVTGLVAGTTTITAKDAKGHTATSIVTVQNELASSVSLSSDAEIEVGASHIFQASVTPNDARDISSITWTSSNTSVATIPQNCAGNTVCEIEGLDEGTTNITVTIGSLSDTSQLDVIPSGVPATNFAVGDYVYMIPSYVGSYTPSTNSSDNSYAGCPANTTATGHGEDPQCNSLSCTDSGSIIPSELRRWIIIKNDGINIEMVSESVSSTGITYTGRIAFENYVNSLNKIAEQYENSLFTMGSRAFGYDNQTLKCSNFAANDCLDYTQHTIDTGGNPPSSSGLVYNAMSLARGNNIAPLIAYSVDTNTYLPSSTTARYWIASRLTGQGSYGLYYQVYSINPMGSLSELTPYYYDSIRYGTTYMEVARVRPILKLKPTAKAASSGDGSANNPWVLSEN